MTFTLTSKCLLSVSSSCVSVRADFLRWSDPSAYRCLLFRLLFSLEIPLWSVPPACSREDREGASGSFIIISSGCRLSEKSQTPGQLPAAVWRPSGLWWPTRLNCCFLMKLCGWRKCAVRVTRCISLPQLSHQTSVFIKYIELSSCFGLWCQAAAQHRLPASSAVLDSRGRSLDPFKQSSDPEHCTNRPSPSDKTEERTCNPSCLHTHEILFLPWFVSSG